MSYCRWSSNNFMCDLYIYEDVRGGWTTHVADLRGDKPSPEMPEVFEGCNEDPEFKKAWDDWVIAEDKWGETRVMRPIGLPHDGETFRHSTPGECAAWARHLLSLGYRAPESAIRKLESEESDARG